MKTKRAIELCKQSRRMSLWEGSGVQWISDGGAAYPLYNLPSFDFASICSTYDILLDKTEKIIFTASDLPREMNFADIADGEIIAEPAPINLVKDGIVMIPLIAEDELEYIDAKYLDPLADARGDLELYRRTTAAGRVYFAAKLGMVVVGIIQPMELHDPHLPGLLGMLARKTKIEDVEQ